MKPLKRAETPSIFIHIRFLLLAVLSGILIITDVHFKSLNSIRYYIETALYPVLFFADSPRSVSDAVSNQFKTRAELMEENERLSTENYLQRVDNLRLKSLEQENETMRKLLNSPVHESSLRMFAEVINVDSDPLLQRIVVNRGASSGVYKGMPVITDEGLVGQVVSVAYYTSRVLLFSDPSSSIPVINTRNQVLAIASGTGAHDELVIDYLPRSIDIKIGDLFVTSGLGGVYPKGYPVAVVSSVGFSEDQSFADVKARPLVDTDKIRYVLMFWYKQNPEDSAEEETVLPKEQTDGKLVLRQAKILELITSLTAEKEYSLRKKKEEESKKAQLEKQAKEQNGAQAEQGTDAEDKTEKGSEDKDKVKPVSVQNPQAFNKPNSFILPGINQEQLKNQVLYLKQSDIERVAKIEQNSNPKEIKNA